MRECICNWFVSYFVHHTFDSSWLFVYLNYYISSSLHELCLLCRFRLVHHEYCTCASVCDALRSRATRKTSSPSFPVVQKTWLEVIEQTEGTLNSNQHKLMLWKFYRPVHTETHLSPVPSQWSDMQHLQSLLGTCIYTPHLSGSQCHRSGTAGTYTRCTRLHSHPGLFWDFPVSAEHQESPKESRCRWVQAVNTKTNCVHYSRYHACTGK